MSIRFHCPNTACNKAFVVKDELAGKRTRCPACNQFLVVPAPVAAPADVEDLAAAALAEKPPEPEVAKDLGTIDFNCPMCDEPIKISAELEGKQAPCPSCRRIIKVPVREKQGPVDWRKATSRLPSGARRDVEPAPEGAWGSATSAGTVSREALEEADAIPAQKVPWTAKQKVQLSAAAVVAVLLLGGATWWGYNSYTRSRQNRALTLALSLADEGKIKSPEEAAEVQRAAGDYLLRAGKVEEARSRYQKARGLLSGGKAETPERDLLLLDLALSQVDLGGDKTEVFNKVRVKWEDALTELRRTLENVRTPEARAEALREVGRKLIGRGQGPNALSLVGSLASGDEVPEAQALVGLELLKAKENKLAEGIADGALGHYKNPAAPAAPGAGSKVPPPSSSLIALFLALGQLPKAQEVVEATAPPAGKKEEKPEVDPAVHLGFVEGTARKGDLEVARQRASATGPPALRVAALLAVANVAVENGQPDAGRPDVEAALKLLKGGGWDQPASPWLLWRLVRLGVQVGLGEAVEEYARLIPDPGLRGRAELELLRGRLAATPGRAEEALLDGLSKGTLAQGVGREWLARHNARTGAGDLQKTIDAWEPEGHRALGAVGQALGLQDANAR
jgi:hypothetical protein